MANNIEQKILEHESRIVRLETEVKNMNSWMSSIDKKLDKVMQSLSYLEGKTRARNNNNWNGNSNSGRYDYMKWAILLGLITNIGLMLAILSKVM